MDKFNNLIGGEWIEGGAFVPNINPSDTNETIGEYAQAEPEQVTAAIGAAAAVFPRWSRDGIQARADALDAIANSLSLTTLPGSRAFINPVIAATSPIPVPARRPRFAWA